MLSSFAGLFFDSIDTDMLQLWMLFPPYIEPIFLKWFYPDQIGICTDDLLFPPDHAERWRGSCCKGKTSRFLMLPWKRP